MSNQQQSISIKRCYYDICRATSNLPSYLGEKVMMSDAIDEDGSLVLRAFARFFEYWLQEQNRHLQILVSAAGEYGKQTDEMKDQNLSVLVNGVLEHYERYYREKERQVMEDVLAMVSAPWLTTLEDCFLWIAGWRPTTVFHLLYSKTSLQVLPHLNELMHGMNVNNLAGLSAAQMTSVDELHRETIRKERAITEKLAKHQASLADTSMVELSNMLSEIMRRNEQINSDQETQVQAAVQSKQATIAKIILKADKLRLETLKAVVGILTPIQAVDFLIAAAELQLRLHDWGKKRDNDTRGSQPF